MSCSPTTTGAVRPYDAGSPRDRLLARFSDLWPRRLGMVVAPAGSGKTTLLGQVAEASGAPVAWYRAEDMYTHPSDLLAQLGVAFAAATGTGGPWRTVREAVAAIQEETTSPVLLVVDDLHRLEGTPAEALLEQFVDRAPPAVAIVAASRATPAWNLSRRRVAGHLVEVSGDDLRFRSWEVEQLFRRHYGMALDPTDLAALTRRTEGWAAALQLFHLAARDKSAAACHRMVAGLGSDLRIVREYLVRNVVDELPGHVRRFLLDTCVLGRLRGDLCDELRDQSGSAALLAELERRQLVAYAHDGGWFRAHDVLRAHLETAFVQSVGEAEGRARYLSAASLLESAGALADALRAFCRAEDWDAAARLLGRKGEELSDGPSVWPEGLSPAILSQDPWLLLAEARRKRAAGDWREAPAVYQRAERAMADAHAAELCRRERAALLAWLEPNAVRRDGWSDRLRSALTRSPMEAHRRCSAGADPRDLLVAGLAALAAGCPRAAARALSRVTDHPDAGPVLVAAAELGRSGAALLSGSGAPPVDRVAEQTESLGIGGLTRIVAALRALAADGDFAAEMTRVVTACEQGGDPWGEAVASLLFGWGMLGRDRPAEAAPAFGNAVGIFARLGAEVPEVLAAALHVLAQARSGGADAGGASAGGARRAEAASRAAGSPGAQAVAMAALVACGGAAGSQLSAETDRLLSDTGLVVPGVPGTRLPEVPGVPGTRLPEVPGVPGTRLHEVPGVPGTPPPGAVPSVAVTAVDALASVRCFRGFVLTVGGHAVDLSGLKPKARKVLRHLAMQYPDWVHREVLMEAVWPGAAPVAGARNLQVVVSTLRHAVEPESLGGRSLIARQGAAYRLVLPPGAEADHVAVDRAVARARAARLAGDTEGTAQALREVLELAAGPFLPEDGPDEWVLPRRTHYRSVVATAALSLAEILAAEGRTAEVIQACNRGLAVDRCADGLWRLLIDTTEAAGDLAASGRAGQEYAAVLAEFGVAWPPGRQAITGRA